MKRRLVLISHLILLAVLLLSGALPFGVARAQNSVWAEPAVASLNVRQGPGVSYEIVGSLASGAKADVTGVHPPTGWLRIAFTAGADGQGWISGSSDYVTVHGSLTDVAQVTDVPAASAATQIPAAIQETASPSATLPAATLGKLVFQTSTGGDIYVINADGTGLRRLTDGYDPALSPDGTRVAFARWSSFPRGLWVINVDGTDAHLVFGHDNKDVGLKAPSWAPDGHRLTFDLAPGDDTQFKACIQFKVPTTGGGTTKLSKCFSGPRHPWWKLATVGVDGQGFRELKSTDFAYSPSWSPDGARIVYASDRGLAFSGDSDNAGDVHDDPNHWLLTDYQGDRSPVWSPDAHRVAFQTKSHDHWEIVVINDDGQGRNQLTRSWPLADVAVNSVAPTWSPDGQWIVYLTDERGRWELYRMRADGSDKGPFLEEALKGIKFQYESVDERVVDWGN